MYKVSELENRYREKLVTAEEAVHVVRSGDRVHYGLFGGIVRDLDQALAKRTKELTDVTVYATIWGNEYVPAILQADPKAEHFHYCNTHFSALDRKLNKEGLCWFVPVQFRENPKLFAENVDGGIDVAMFQTAPMDAYGNFNFGPQLAEYWGILKRAKTVIVEVNENMPINHGMQNVINLSQITYVVEGSSHPLNYLESKPATEVELKIAEHIVPYIKSGSTLQLGIGGIPNTIGAMLADSQIDDLSVHTEMFVEAYLKLYEAGKITGNKNRDKGKMVYTFASGSKKLFDFIDGNPITCVAPVDYVNDIGVIGSIDQMVSINSCLQVDLFGQVNSESAGWQHIGGTGGQLDYVMGAFHSNGGQSFLCTPSVRVKKDGTMESLIRPRLSEGSIVSVPRSAVHYVVTEYGAVNLKGKTTYERAELLISIAHPKFREQLAFEAGRMGLSRTSSRVMTEGNG